MMRPTAFALAACACALAATPARATQGQSCRPAAGSGPVVSIVIGSLGIVGASVSEGGRTLSSLTARPALALRQSWIDPDRLWIDFVDADRMSRDEGRLRLQAAGRGRTRHFAGTFVRGGRVYRMACSES